MSEDEFKLFEQFREWQRQRDAEASAAPTLRDLWARYEEAQRPKLKSWDRVTVGHARHLLAHWGALPVTAIDHESADIYVAKRQASYVSTVTDPDKMRLVSPNTVGHELDTLRACLNWCVRRRLIAGNGLDGYENPSAPAREDKPLLPDERAKLLLASVNPLARMMLGFALETGMRRDEWRLLTWREVNLGAKRVELPATRTKAKKARAVPLSREALRILELAPRYSDYVFPYVRGGPVAKTTLDTWWRKTLETAGLEHRRLHSLRLTWGTMAAYELGMPLRMAMAILGHSSKDVHDRYVRWCEEFEVDARAFLDGQRRGPQQARREDVEEAIRQLADE